MVSVELGEALLHEQSKLRCEVLLWQRWVRYLALGATNKELSYALGLPEKTTSRAVSQILKKLRVKSRVELAALFDSERATRFDVSVGDSRWQWSGSK